jgi:hypothetical protein
MRIWTPPYELVQLADISVSTQGGFAASPTHLAIRTKAHLIS